MKPTVGRIVHYVSAEFNDMHQAALISMVDGDKVILHLFNPCVDDAQGLTAILVVTGISQDETGKTPGTWHWPERE